jgi:hypothetical protein
VIGDFDENGTLDIYYANWGTPNRLCLQPTGEPGEFDCIDTSSPDYSTAAEVGDVNGDGHLDLLVGHDGWEQDPAPDELCLGDGTTAFACSAVPGNHSYTAALALADMNGDGNLDYLLLGEPNLLCIGAGDGEFECVHLDLEVRDDRGFGVVGGFTGVAVLP